MELRAQWGSVNVENARVAIGLNAVVDIDKPDGFLIRPLEMGNLLSSIAGSCLPNNPLNYAYSNADPLWFAHVVQHLTYTEMGWAGQLAAMGFSCSPI